MYREKFTKDAILFELLGDANPYSVGRTWVCSVCGTRVRQGQPHRTEVFPAHTTMEAVIIEDLTS
jgi:hypothetical protein